MKADTYRGRYRLNAHALRAFRRVIGMTQVDLATASGTHNSFISRLERGERFGCTHEVARSLAAALGVPTEALIAAPLTQSKPRKAR
ncbi:hypothetical protein Aph01nite_13340 [Acrocarpospora phusangensis]|uniref:HTH cro/C1-type domain-containing protein n=1 Tax=Acrocarpospora phusangensis TaxID=1070424 RepID=A0A919Q600_9ACTN|nr:hypothetical protein Aph01nite_13340 [Acrocarpospora phusangensis]